jgi:hypothetical protein
MQRNRSKGSSLWRMNPALLLSIVDKCRRRSVRGLMAVRQMGSKG